MEVGRTRKRSAPRGVNATAAPEEAPAIEAAPSEFRAFLADTLGKSGSEAVNEEALFSSMVHERVTRNGSKDAVAKFETRIDKHRRILERNGGYVSEEKAAKFALRDLVRNDLMSKDEATKIYSMAFAAAQLDDDTNALSDSIGGNASKAQAAYTKALSLSEERMLGFTGGTQQFAMRRLGETSTQSADDVASTSGASGGPSSPVDGNNGFLFKPVSDTQGKLVVLLPAEMTSKISEVLLKDSSGKVLEKGQYGGVGNGEREHFRYSRPGGSYPGNLTVEVRMKGGGTKTYQIADPSKRYD